MPNYLAQKANPVSGFRFQVTFSDSSFADSGFASIRGLGAAVEVVRYREGGQTTSMRKMPGLTNFPDLVLERGVSYNSDMYTWCEQAFVISPNSAPKPDNYNGTSFRKNFSIAGYDSDFATVVKNWECIDAWPSEHSFGDFDAQTSAVQIERMTIQHEGLYQIKFG